jgi:hypothetical protein
MKIKTRNKSGWAQVISRAPVSVDNQSMLIDFFWVVGVNPSSNPVIDILYSDRRMSLIQQ